MARLDPRIAALVQDVARVVEGATGFRTDGGTSGMVLAAARAVSTNASLEDVLRDLRAGAQGAHWESFLDQLVVTETAFFRHPAQFRMLEGGALAELARAARAAGRPHLRLWSAACATGEEAYSLAVTALQHAPTLEVPRVEVWGTDVSRGALERAERGIYDPRAVACVPPDVRGRFFTTRPSGIGVTDDVRRVVRFARFNLVTGEGMAPADCDLIFCRNVTIYFARERIATVMDRLASALVPGGLLVLGHAEALWGLSDRFAAEERDGVFLYRLIGAPSCGPSPAPVRKARAAPRAEMTADGAMDQAMRARRAGRGEEAERILRSLLEREKNHADAVTAAAYCALDRQEWTAVAQLANRIDYAAGLSADAACLRGIAHLRHGDAHAALVELRRALYIDADFPLARYYMAEAYDTIGEVQCAAHSYTAVDDTAAPVAPPSPARTRLLDIRRTFGPSEELLVRAARSRAARSR